MFETCRYDVLKHVAADAVSEINLGQLQLGKKKKIAILEFIFVRKALLSISSVSRGKLVVSRSFRYITRLLEDWCAVGATRLCDSPTLGLTSRFEV